MAQGYKDFTAGATLAAADLEDYCQNQSVLRFASAAARDAACAAILTNGLMTYQTDTSSLTIYNGSIWVRMAAGGAWTTWTPTIASWTQGNGTVVAVYEQVGRTVNCYVIITWGTTSSGFVGTVSVPKTAARAGALGVSYINDSGGSAYPAVCLLETTTTATVYVTVASGTYTTITGISATVPFTFATGDSIRFSLTYEAAADGT